MYVSWLDPTPLCMCHDLMETSPTDVVSSGENLAKKDLGLC